MSKKEWIFAVLTGGIIGVSAAHFIAVPAFGKYIGFVFSIADPPISAVIIIVSMFIILSAAIYMVIMLLQKFKKYYKSKE